MLKDSLYLYALLLFSFTALQNIETCSEFQDESVMLGKSSYGLDYLTCEEASAMYALLEDDNEELNEFSEKQFSSCKQDENNPKEVNKHPYLFARSESEEKFIILPMG